MRETPNDPNIGYPKLFIGGAAGRREVPAAPTVNNFAAATGAACGFRMAAGFHFLYPTGFPAPTGQAF
jgi:hypothetical protein